ncbi:MAG: type IV toxin-antitoxin system AbiEi family antitoxin domain-containing protein [Candidatus Firestonebacteria bacterium]
MKALELYNKLGKSGVFTASDIKRYLGVTESALRKLIWRYQKHGVLVKLRNGFYTLKGDHEPDSFLLANKLYAPSYISFETALSYYGIISETVYTLTSATPKITRNFSSLGREFSYRKIKKEAYGGYKPVKIGGNTVLIAEPEKALADQLYFVFLKKTKKPERLNPKKYKKVLVKKYIRLFANSNFLKWSLNAF